MSPAIKVITGLVLAMTVALLLAAVKVHILLLVGAVLATIALFCYLYAPIAYELTGDQLTVRLRMGRKVFQAVTKCATLTARPPMGVRLWGNGGLFAATGIFWNPAYGVYRAYVTSARYQDYVLVETLTQKVLISPENPEDFVRAWASSTPAAPAPG
jgi:hypothetical protein